VPTGLGRLYAVEIDNGRLELHGKSVCGAAARGPGVEVMRGETAYVN
jgi:hypothetical protein